MKEMEKTFYTNLALDPIFGDLAKQIIDENGQKTREKMRQIARGLMIMSCVKVKTLRC